MAKLDFMKVPKSLFDVDDFDTLSVKDYQCLILTYVYILLNESCYDDVSNISVGDLLLYYGVKLVKDKPKFYYDVIKSLRFFASNNHIQLIGQTLLDEEPPYKNNIRMKLDPKFFHPDRYFFNIYTDELKALNEISDENNLKKDLVFTLYFYIRNVINSSNKNIFFCNTDTILKNIGFTKTQIESAMKCFVNETNSYTSLLIKVKNKSSISYKENESFMRKDGHNIIIERKF